MPRPSASSSLSLICRTVYSRGISRPCEDGWLTWRQRPRCPLEGEASMSVILMRLSEVTVSAQGRPIQSEHPSTANSSQPTDTDWTLPWCVMTRAMSEATPIN